MAGYSAIPFENKKKQTVTRECIHIIMLQSREKPARIRGQKHLLTRKTKKVADLPNFMNFILKWGSKKHVPSVIKIRSKVSFWKECICLNCSHANANKRTYPWEKFRELFLAQRHRTFRIYLLDIRHKTDLNPTLKTTTLLTRQPEEKISAYKGKNITRSI